MHKLLRSTAVGLAAAGVLAGAASATPALVVKTSQLVRSAGAATIATREDAGTYRTTVSAPAAYRLSGIRPGKQIGTATVHVATAVGALTFRGWIVAVPTNSFVNDQCAAFAEQPVSVWLLQVRQTDGLARTEIPVYVTYGPGGSTQMTWCASAASGMTVTGVSLTLSKALLNPTVAGRYAWHASFDNVNAASRSTFGTVTTSATAVVRVRARR